MKRDDLFYQIALTLVPNIGSMRARILLERYGDAQTIFHTSATELGKIEGIGSIHAGHIQNFSDFNRIEEEIAFIEKHAIQPLFLTDAAYPQRMLKCYDPPILLYYKGNADLNASRILSIVGTRNNTEYGRYLTEQLIKELADYNILVISGLAFGIDAIAHKNSLKQGLSTVGVLAHGLDTLYPQEHASLAKDMIRQGGLLTAFRSGTRLNKGYYPARNRIVAGMSDATVVIETGIKGGSMITAEIAHSYNRDVFAFPGRITDHKSAGCSYLIKKNKAVLLTDAEQLLTCLGWDKENTLQEKTSFQKAIFLELSPEEKKIVEILKEKQQVHIDEMNIKSNLSASTLAAVMLNLELQDVITSMPGKMYKLASV